MNPILLQPASPRHDGPVLLERADPASAVVEAPVLLRPHRETPDGVHRRRAAVLLRALRADTTVPAIPRELPPPQPVTLPPRGFFRVFWHYISRAIGWVFGSISLIFGLAILASIPIVQFLSLGYLLEAAGRLGRSGRFRDAFPGVRIASRIGGAVLGSLPWLALWFYMHGRLLDSALLDPGSRRTLLFDIAVPVAFVRALIALIPVHLGLALARGGRLRYFIWPNLLWFVRRLAQGGYFREAWTHTVVFLRSLRLWHYFSLGLRGYIGAGALLLVPTTLYAIGQGNGLALLGGPLLAMMLLYVPFLQVHFAAENRLRAMFELGIIRERFCRAPIAYLFAFVFTLALSLPLYLFKIQVVPRDALWLPALVFIVTIFPVKVMTGWAYGRSRRRLTRAHFIFRFFCRLLMFPVAAFYAFFVFFTQYTGWHGVLGLYEHHAFLLPVPF